MSSPTASLANNGTRDDRGITISFLSTPAVAVAPADATMAMSPDTNIDAAPVAERTAQPAPVVAETTDESMEVTDDGIVTDGQNATTTNSAAADEDDEVAVVTIPGIDEPPSRHALVAAAASEPAQGSDWWLPILGFDKSEVVQDCYDASQVDTRLRGCWVAWGFAALWFIHRLSVPRPHVSGWVRLVPLCMAGLVTAVLPIALCIISGDRFNKRHTLRKIAHGLAFMAVVATVTANLTRLESSAHASSVSWEETILLGCPLVMLPLYISLLLRVSFPWAAMVCIAFSIGYLVIISSATTERLNLMSSVLFFASATTSILYATEASAQQLFVEQLHSTKVQRDLDLSKARVAQMELAILHRSQADLASAQIAQHRTQADLASAQIAQLVTKKELTRTQMERAKAEVGGCSTAGQFNILEGITRVKRTPKLAQVWCREGPGGRKPPPSYF
jgi:hypothetical protein